MWKQWASADRGRHAERAAMLVCVLLGLWLLWLVVHLLWTLLPGEDPSATGPVRVAPADAVAPSSPSVSRWHLFGHASAPALLQRQAPATTLSLNLRGTLAERDPRTGIAVIADAGGSERAWRVGDEIAPGVRLDEVHADHVVLMHDGAAETLTLPRDAPTTAVAPLPTAAASASRGGGVNAALPLSVTPPQMAHGAVDWQKAMDTLRADPAELARKMQFAPIMENGRISGVRLSAGDNPALLGQLGLRPSDIVTAVNGVPVDSVARGQQVLDSLKGATSVRVTVTRDGKPTEITLSLR